VSHFVTNRGIPLVFHIVDIIIYTLHPFFLSHGMFFCAADVLCSYDVIFLAWKSSLIQESKREFYKMDGRITQSRDGTRH